VHTFAGFLGGAVAPALILGLTAFAGLSTTLIFAGAVGVVTAAGLLLMPKHQPREHRAHLGPPGATSGRARTAVLSRAVLTLTGFFALIALSNSAINTFSVAALMSAHHASFAGANAVLTSYLAFSAIGVLLGGWLADRTHRHGIVAAVGFGLSALTTLFVAIFVLSVPALVLAMGISGGIYGVVQPARDMLVRRAAPPGMVGSVFGVVSTGFNIGGIIGPPMFGWLMDRGSPRWVFGGILISMVMAALVGLLEERRGRPRAQGSQAA
jgi:MFS family permease